MNSTQGHRSDTNAKIFWTRDRCRWRSCVARKYQVPKVNVYIGSCIPNGLFLMRYSLYFFVTYQLSSFSKREIQDERFLGITMTRHNPFVQITQNSVLIFFHVTLNSHATLFSYFVFCLHIFASTTKDGLDLERSCFDYCANLFYVESLMYRLNRWIIQRPYRGIIVSSVCCVYQVTSVRDR